MPYGIVRTACEVPGCACLFCVLWSDSAQMLQQGMSQHDTQLLLMDGKTGQGSPGIQESLLQACRMIQTKHLMVLVVHLARLQFCPGLQTVQSSGRPVCGHLSVLCHAAAPVTVSRAAHMPHKPLHHHRPSLLPQLPMLLETRVHHLPLHREEQCPAGAPQAQRRLHQPQALCTPNHTCQTHLCQSPMRHLQLLSAVRWVLLNQAPGQWISRKTSAAPLQQGMCQAKRMQACQR